MNKIVRKKLIVDSQQIFPNLPETGKKRKKNLVPLGQTLPHIIYGIKNVRLSVASQYFFLLRQKKKLVRKENHSPPTPLVLNGLPFTMLIDCLHE